MVSIEALDHALRLGVVYDLIFDLRQEWGDEVAERLVQAVEASAKTPDQIIALLVLFNQKAVGVDAKHRGGDDTVDVAVEVDSLSRVCADEIRGGT